MTRSNACARFPKATAVVFALLMLSAALPMSAAEHTPQVPGTVLPHVQPGDNCVQTGLSPEAFRLVNAVRDRDSGYFAQNKTVPVLCGTDGRPLNEFKDLVRFLDAQVDQFRTSANALQQQANTRIEQGAPEGKLPPRVLFLNDSFEEKRTTGIGDWQVVTQDGSAGNWRIEQKQNFSGIEGSYRFGTDAGYTQGVREFLISPEVDLRAVRGDDRVKQELDYLKAQSKASVRTFCTGLALPGTGFSPGSLACNLGDFGLQSSSSLAEFFGADAELASTLVGLYEAQFDVIAESLPIGKPIAELSFSYRSNFADTEDGVRFWIFEGDQAPDRITLFQPNFGYQTTYYACQHYNELRVGNGQSVNKTIEDQKTAGANRAPPDCFQQRTSGAVIEFDGMRSTAGFAGSNASKSAFTGYTPEERHIKLDLSNWAGKRIWVLFEAGTRAVENQGSAYFTKDVFKQEQARYGFELKNLTVEGDGYGRNMRLHEPSTPVFRVYTDANGDLVRTRTVVPPQENGQPPAPVVFHVFNAGEYRENATVTVEFFERNPDGAAFSGNRIGAPKTFDVFNVKPDEVLNIVTPWPTTIKDGVTYDVRARMVVHDFTSSGGTDPTAPNATNVRFVNFAERDGALLQETAISSFLVREFAPVAPIGNGFPIEVCEGRPTVGKPCNGLYAAEKGAPRTLRIAYVNDGNAAETATATLHLSLEGVDKSDAILDGSTRTLRDVIPGEKRELQWALALNEPGIYRSIVTVQLPDGTHIGKTVQRLIFSQQTTGLICFDDFDLSRECGPSFVADIPVELRGVDLTAAAFSADGTLYAASRITNTTGALYARAADGTWTQLEDLRNTTLTTTRQLQAQRPDLGFGTIRTLTFAPDGTLYMTGDNATALARSPTGALISLAKKDLGPAPLRAYAGGLDHQGYVNQGHLIIGGATGGVAPYTYEWVPLVNQSNVTNNTNVSAHMVVTPIKWGNYSFELRATDSLGATATALARFTALNGTPTRTPYTCGGIEYRETVMIGEDPAGDATGGAGGASDLRCLRVTETKDNFRFFIDVAGRDLSPQLKLPLEYRLNFTAGGAKSITAAYYGSGSDVFAIFVQPTTETKQPGVVKAWFEGNTLVLEISKIGIAGTMTGIELHTRSCVPTEQGCTKTQYDRMLEPAVSYVTGRDSQDPVKVTGLGVSRLQNGSLALNWNQGVDNQSSVRHLVLRALPGTGAYSVIGNVSGTTFVDGGTIPGATYDYRIAAQDAAGYIGQSSDALEMRAETLEPFRGAAVIFGKTHIVGPNGQLHVVNGSKLDPVNLTYTKANGATARFTGELRAIGANATTAYAGGDDGVLFVNTGHGWNLTQTVENRNLTGDACTDADRAKAICDRSIRSITFTAGHAWIAGANGLMLRSQSATTFVDLPPLPLITGQPNVLKLLPAHTGSVYAITEAGAAFECVDCTKKPVWAESVFILPYIATAGGSVQPARITSTATNGQETVLVGEGGAISALVRTGTYDNQLGWTTAASLLPTHGGAVEAHRGHTDAVAWRGLPEMQDLSNAGTRVRVDITHHIVNASPTNPAEIRVVLAENPSATASTVKENVHTCPAKRLNESRQGYVAGRSFCENTSLAAPPIVFTEPTRSNGWVTDSFEFDLSRYTAGRLALDLFADINTHWVVDDVQMWVVSPDGTSYLMLSYFTPTNQDPVRCTASLQTACNKGTWGIAFAHPGNTVSRTDYECDQRANQDCPIPAIPPLGDTFVVGNADWRENCCEVATMDPVSAWHLTRALADRPVWAANDEIWNHEPGGSLPRLRDNWNMRLVSPVLDLRNAYSPVLEFDHLYAFRTLVTVDKVSTQDGGFVQVQYEKTGKECGAAASPDTTCWSPFYTIRPVGDYPTRKSLGYESANSIVDGSYSPKSATPAYALPKGLDEAGLGYWGRTANIGDTGTISDIADTTKYQTARFNLTHVHDEKGNSVDLAGRFVRVGFQLVTAHTGNGQSTPTDQFNWTHKDAFETGVSVGGEGWYITDFKVMGAKKLGVDLKTSDLRFAVGYDADTVGVGPGQRVPVNVTVTNGGIFDALGYTGTLVVNRVIDPVIGSSEVIERIPLAQQPTLAPGAMRNHTFYWNVPATENGQYFLDATVTPIGIDRDEDHTDNSLRLGSFGEPVVAQTTKQFHVEFGVTPENATSDITRYVPITLVNTGNVPLGQIKVDREITVLKGPLTSVIERKEWTTDAALPAGSRVPLASLDNEFDAVQDLFWKAPERANYYIVVSAQTNAEGLRSTTDKRVSAFATFLFDDVESGVKGESITGGWNLTGWAPTGPGFRSSESYGFGDSALGRYAPNADATLTSPVIDLSNARSANLAFYQKYLLENGFDAGLVEASVDGGKTWTPISPIADVLNGLKHGYNDQPLVASSPLHPDGDPTRVVRGVTGDSSKLAANADGWVLSQFDLTNYPGVTRYNVPYEDLALSTFAVKEPVTGRTINGGQAYLADSWVVGAIDETRYWEVDNLTERAVKSRAGADTFWWSGSPSLDDAALPVIYDFEQSTKLGFSPVNGSTVVRTTDAKVDGQGSLRVTRGDTDESAVSQKLPLKPGLKYHFAAYYDAVNSRDARFVFNFSNATGGIVGTPQTVNAGRTVGFNLVQAQVNPPLGATNMTIKLVLAGAPKGDVGRFDAFTLTELARPYHNLFLHVPVDLTDIPKGGADVVQLEWWEWMDHSNLRPLYVAPGNIAAKDSKGSFIWTDNSEAAMTWRLNVTQPSIVERDGDWYKMVSTLDDNYKGEKFDVTFVYATVTTSAGNAPTYSGKSLDDRGLVIDGFTVKTFRSVNGQPTDIAVRMNETQAWSKSFVTTCLDVWGGANGPPTSPIALPCYETAAGNRGWKEKALLPQDAPTWTLKKELAPLTAPWTVVPVRDEKSSPILPTGETVKAFYTGDIMCKALQCQAPDHLEDCRITGCLRPLTESRLVTPAIDMGLVAGQNAEFVFTHRYLFENSTTNFKRDPLASGGVVEVQAYDPQTGEWGEWRQVFNKQNTTRTDPDNKARPQCCFGYSWYTANDTKSTSGGTFHRNPPFEPVRNETLGADYMYLFTGNSSLQPGASPNGWVNARFDVSEYIGKTVRFGFHYDMSGLQRGAYTNQLCMPIPDADNKCQSGWWIRNITLQGNVLAGSPTLVRLHAATDGNLNEGGWNVDDLGLFGSRYENNLAVFVDESQGPFGAQRKGSGLIPITVQNLGTTVRRGLAVEVLQLDSANSANPRLNFTATDAGTVSYQTIDGVGVFRIQNIDLGPGAKATFHVKVTAPDTVTPGTPTQTVYFQLKEYNGNAKTFTRITDNEVQGFLKATTPFALYATGQVVAKAPITTPVDPRVNEPVTLRIPVENTRFLPIDLNVTCKAEVVYGWNAVDHRRNETPTYTVSSTVPCKRVQGDDRLDGTTKLSLAPMKKGELVFEATPIESGTLRLDVTARYFDGLSEVAIKSNVTAGVSVGKSPVIYSTNFTEQRPLQENFTTQHGGPSPLHSKEQGYTARGSMLLGVDDTRPAPTMSARTYIVTTPTFDLRNSTTGAFLSFWHLDRMAKGDGAHVRAQILLVEERPNSGSSYTVNNYPAGPLNTYDCLLRPIGGYEGSVRSSIAPSQTGGGGQDGPTPANDFNPAYTPPVTASGGQFSSPGKDFFITPDGVPESTWQQAVFDLSAASCQANVEGKPTNLSLIGHVVRFQIVHYAGPSKVDNGIEREPAHGFYVDDLSVGPLHLKVGPATQKGIRILDNTTKTFHVVVENRGAIADRVLVSYDEANSTAPRGSIRTPAEPIVLLPGEKRNVPIEVTLPRDPSLLPTEFEARVRAQSLFDPNAVGTSTFSLLFAPREFAELRVLAESPTRGVQEGTETFIPIVVENTGLVANVPSVIEITDRWTENGVPKSKTSTLELPSMSSFFQDADDSRRTLEFAWRPEAGSVGPHTLTIVVDPQVLGEEYTRTNNVITLNAQVVKLLIPDLTLAHSDALVLRNNIGNPLAGTKDAEVTRYEVTTGELVSFQVKVRNIGAGGVTNVDVRTFIGQLSLPAKTVPFIAPGGETTVNFNWLAQKGEYPIEVLVRSEQVEISTANNRYPVNGVVLLTVKDFEVKANATGPDSILEPGTEAPITFTLTNTGTAGEEIRLRGKLPAGWDIRFPRGEMFLRAGETYTDTATLVVPAHATAGEQFISVLAVSRENPMKVAAGETPVNVRAFYEGAVVPGVVSATPPTFILPVKLSNTGNSLEPWSVNVKLPAGWTTTQALPVKVVVPARGETTLDLVVNLPPATPPALREVVVNATLADGSSHEAKMGVELKARRGADVQLSGALPRESRGALSYTVQVTNVGNVEQPFRVVLAGLPDGIDARVQPANFTLAPGQKATATLRVAPNQTVASGTYKVTTYALFDGVHPDTTEGRANFHAVDVSIARPDLAVVALEQTPRADVKEGDRVTLRATVTNRGGAPATNLPVHLYADDVFIAETRVNLQPGETRDIVLNWTALGGQHTLAVFVDPYGDTLDATRDDHATSTQTNVQGTGAVGPLAAERTNGIPAPGLFGLMTALFAAVALAAGRRRIAK